MKKLLFLFATIMISCSLYSQQISQHKYPAAESLFSNRDATNIETTKDFINDHLRENIREYRLDEPLLDSSLVYLFLSEVDSIKDYRNKYFRNDNGDLLQRLTLDWDIDNLKWVNYRKADYTYDDDGNQLSFLQYRWDSGISAWVGMYNIETTYDEFGYINMWMQSEWNESYQRWDKWMRAEFENDENGNELEAILYYPDNDNEWQPSGKNENTLNPDGSLNLVLIYSWNIDTDDWDLSRKHTYAYNEDGLLEEEQMLLYDSGDWLVDKKWEHEYTSSGKTAVTTSSLFREDEWTYDTKTEYSYDGQDNILLQLDSNWEFDKWINSVKRESTYDSYNNEVFHIRKSWDNSLDQWINDLKKENAFNDNNQQTLISAYDWKEPLNKWEGIFREGYIYDEIGNASIYEIYSWDQVLDNWLIHKKYFNFYSLLEEILEQPTGGIRVYPNPVINSLSIQTGKTAGIHTAYTLFSLTGEAVRKGILKQSSLNLDLSDLPVGIYFLQIEHGQKRTIEKIIKQ